jgi:ribosomal protein S18 acetylase RimI-like enzyme
MRDELLEFELALDSLTCEELVEHEWGRAFLSPSLPLAWDASWILIEGWEMTAEQIVAAADEGLSRFAHRTVAVREEAEGARLAREFAAMPGWEVEVTLYMRWRQESGRTPSVEVVETSLAGCEELRRQLIAAELPAGTKQVEATSEQLLEMNRRFATVGGDRWFVAPPQSPASACCLLTRDGIGQVEEVGTLAAARGRGLAQSVVLTALTASRRAGHHLTFLTAEADDWPRHLYERLGFRACGELHVLRRLPT